MEEVRITFDSSIVSQTNNKSFYNLWYDIGAKLDKSVFGIENMIKTIVDKELKKLYGVSASVSMVEFYTSRITRYAKLEGGTEEIVIRIWFSNIIKSSIVSASNTVDLSFLNIDIVNMFNRLNITDFPEVRFVSSSSIFPLNDWEKVSIASSSILPFSNQIPTYTWNDRGIMKIGSSSLPAELDITIVTPPETIFSTVNDNSLTYYTVNGIWNIILIVATIIFILLPVIMLRKNR